MVAVIEFVHWLYDKSMATASFIVRNSSNVAPHILLGLGFILLLSLVSQGFRTGLSQILSVVFEFMKNIWYYIKEFLKSAWEVLTVLWEALKPFVRIAVEFHLFLFDKWMETVMMIQELEQLRPNLHY